MSMNSWQQRIHELADELSDIALEMSEDHGFCEVGLEFLLSRTMVLAVVGSCDPGEDYLPKMVALQKRFEEDVAMSISMKEKRKH